MSTTWADMSSRHSNAATRIQSTARGRAARTETLLRKLTMQAVAAGKLKWASIPGTQLLYKVATMRHRNVAQNAEVRGGQPAAAANETEAQFRCLLRELEQARFRSVVDDFWECLMLESVDPQLCAFHRWSCTRSLNCCVSTVVVESGTRFVITLSRRHCFAQGESSRMHLRDLPSTACPHSKITRV